MTDAAANRNNAAPLPVGTRVRVATDAEYYGLTGDVVSVHGPNRRVRFDAWHELPDLLFHNDELEAAP